MTTEDIYTTIDKVKGEILALERFIIPDYEEELAHLIDPDYEPEDNPNPEEREDDIDLLTWELWEHQGDLYALHKELKNLYRKLAVVILGPGGLPPLED